MLAAVGPAYNARMLLSTSFSKRARAARAHRAICGVIVGAIACTIGPLLVGSPAAGQPVPPDPGPAAASSSPSPSPSPAESPALTGVPADLKRDEIRCAGDTCAIGACLLQSLAADGSRELGSVRIVPEVAQGAVRGFRLFALRPGSLPARLGLANGDVVLTLDGHPLTTPEQALTALGALRTADSLLLELDRQGQPLLRRIHLDRRPLRDGECPLPPAATPPTATTPSSIKKPAVDTSEALRAIAKDLRCQGSRCTMRRSTVDEILARSELLARSGRIVPVFKEGKAQGFKLFAIRPGSLLALLGLRNGDELRDINGFELSTPERALAAYASLRSASELRVSLVRSGAPLTRTYVIVP